MKTSIFIILVMAAQQLVMEAESVQDNSTVPGIFNFVNLGSVDGKNYFYDNIKLSYTASIKHCEDGGMILATIETASQAAFLKSKYNSMTFTDYFWTGARDAQLPRQFTWSTGTVPNESIGLPWVIYHGTLESQTCVLYLSSPLPELVIFKCIDATNTSVLCQT